MIEFIFFVFVVIFSLLILGFFLKEYVLVSVSSMGIIIFGIFIAINGLLGLNNFLSDGLALILIGVGAYIFIRSGIEKLQEVER